MTYNIYSQNADGSWSLVGPYTCDPSLIQGYVNTLQADNGVAYRAEFMDASGALVDINSV